MSNSENIYVTQIRNNRISYTEAVKRVTNRLIRSNTLLTSALSKEDSRGIVIYACEIQDAKNDLIGLHQYKALNPKDKPAFVSQLN